MAKNETKDQVLKIQWSKKENDFVVSYPESKATGSYVLHQLFGKRFEILPKETGKTFELKALWEVKDNPYMAVFESEDFRKEMEKRGYDLTTLQFSIKKKKT